MHDASAGDISKKKKVIAMEVKVDIEHSER